MGIRALDFLMTREVTHFQSFSAALSEVVPNSPPGVLQANPRYSHAYFNMSNGQDVRSPGTMARDRGQKENGSMCRTRLLRSAPHAASWISGPRVLRSRK